MRSGKTHSALLEIEGRKGRQTRGPGREEQVQPIWHVELESETYIQTQIAARLSHSDPLLISLCLSLYLFHSPCNSHSVFRHPSARHFSLIQTPSMSFIPVFPLSLTCFSLSPLRLCLFPPLVLLSARLMRAAMGYSRFISLSRSRTWAFAVRVFAAPTESGASSASHRGLQ